MMPHCKRETQFELFEAAAAAAAQASAVPLLPLPVQRASEINTIRAAKILGVSKATVLRLLHRNLLRSYAVGKLGHRRIDYDSLVEYCDRLRLEYRIPTKVARTKGFRLRDRDVPPFPLDETIGAREVCRALDCLGKRVTHLLEEGELTGYQILLRSPTCPWRIHAPSLARYLARLHAASGSSRGASGR